MKTSIPKQFLPLSGKPIALHSFELFSQMEEIDEIIVVCEPKYRSLFPAKKFALPGIRRQDSIYNGFCLVSPEAGIISTHDAARPFVDKALLLDLFEQTLKIGAATLAAPVVSTIKECHEDRMVKKTLPRSQLWEIQTPQAMKRSLFERGFAQIQKQNIDITDDVFLAEVLNEPVAIIPSSHRNLKITTPIDLAVAKAILCDIN